MKTAIHTTASALAVSLFALFVLVTGIGIAGAAERWPVDAMNRQIDQTNFVVNSGCSGTLIDLKNRYILTAAHCVGAQYKVIEKEEIADDGTVTKKEVRVVVPGEVRQIVFNGPSVEQETVYRTRMLAVDKARDLALVQILAEVIPNIAVSKIACADPVRGEAAYIVGNPAGVLYSSVAVGVVSSLQRTYGELGISDLGGGPTGSGPLMQVSAGIIGGNSGGAVYNDAGELIGVPVVGHRTNEVIGFAVPLAEIKAFLKANGAGDLVAGCAATS